MADFDVYLYFSGNSSDPAIWDSEFSYYFGAVLNQILENAPRIISNANVPAATQIKDIENKDFNKIRAFILVLGGEERNSETLEPVKKLVDYLTDEQRHTTYLIRRPQKRSTEIPDFLKNFSVYSFYEIANSTQTVFGHNHKEGLPENGFWETLTDLGYDLKHILFSKDQIEISESRINTIFLAEVTADQHRNRERLRRELRLAGFNVLPDSPLPLSLKEIESEVQDLLEKSVLSVHIMGELYGNSPDGTDYSYQEIQNRQFNDVSKKLQSFDDVQPKMERIVWIQPVFDPYDEKQVQYIKRLRRDISILKDSELIQSTVHDLKSIIDRKFRLLKTPIDVTTNFESDQILLIADDYMDIACNSIQEELRRNLLNLSLLQEVLTRVNDIELIMSELKRYKNILVLNTKSDSLWLESILNLLARSKGYQNAVPKSLVGYFSPLQAKIFPEFHTLTVEAYTYSSKNIGNTLQSFITKVKT